MLLVSELRKPHRTERGAGQYNKRLSMQQNLRKIFIIHHPTPSRPHMTRSNPITEDMLFILGHVLQESQKQFSNKPLSVYISKADFISIALHLGAVAKHERAIYKNLELLEKSRLISYKKDKQKRSLRLSQKGYQAFQRLAQRHEDWHTIRQKIEQAELLKGNRIFQTVLEI